MTIVGAQQAAAATPHSQRQRLCHSTSSPRPANMFDVTLQPPYDISAEPLCTSYNTGSVLTLCLMKTILTTSNREVAFQIIGNGNNIKMSVTCENHKSSDCWWPGALYPMLRVHSDRPPSNPRYLWMPDDCLDINLLESNIWHTRFLFVRCECPIFLKLADEDCQTMLAFSVVSP
jgi:hypothetical protein